MYKGLYGLGCRVVSGFVEFHSQVYSILKVFVSGFGFTDEGSGGPFIGFRGPSLQMLGLWRQELFRVIIVLAASNPTN